MIWTELVIFRNIYVHASMYAMTINKEVINLKENGEGNMGGPG